MHHVQLVNSYLHIWICVIRKGEKGRLAKNRYNVQLEHRQQQKVVAKPTTQVMMLNQTQILNKPCPANTYS